MADYPAALPIKFPFEEPAPDYGVIADEFEKGYVQRRARTTIAPRVYRFSHQSLTAAEVSTWITFWNARKGAESFNFTDPRTASVVICVFKQGIEPVITRTGPQTYDVEPVELEEQL